MAHTVLIAHPLAPLRVPLQLLRVESINPSGDEFACATMPLADLLALPQQVPLSTLFGELSRSSSLSPVSDSACTFDFDALVAALGAAPTSKHATCGPADVLQAPAPAMLGANVSAATRECAAAPTVPPPFLSPKSVGHFVSGQLETSSAAATDSSDAPAASSATASSSRPICVGGLWSSTGFSLRPAATGAPAIASFPLTLLVSSMQGGPPLAPPESSSKVRAGLRDEPERRNQPPEGRHSLQKV